MTSFNVTMVVFPTAQDEDELFSDIPKEGDYLEKYCCKNLYESPTNKLTIYVHIDFL